MADMDPVTTFCRVGDDHVAYQTMGTGDVTIIGCTGIFSGVDVRLADPRAATFYRDLARTFRLVFFDRRGSGASDVPARRLTWEDFVEDIGAVADVAGGDQLVLIAVTDAGPAALLFAAQNPGRVKAMVLYTTYAKPFSAPGYDIGREDTEEGRRHFIESWGRDDHPEVVRRLAETPGFRWGLRMQRATMPPGRVPELVEMIREIDARPVVPLVKTPTLILRTPEPAFFGAMTWLHEHLPSSVLVDLDRSGPMFVQDQAVLGRIREFVGTQTGKATDDRYLATVMFTDIVGSTRRAEREGDARWRALLDHHDAITEQVVETNGGRVVKSTGDGALAVFDGPARAIRAGHSICAQVSTIGIAVRVGIHCGEIERRGTDIGGIGVHIAARAVDAAAPNEVLITRTVRDLIAGSGVATELKGLYDMKGVADRWELYAAGPG